MDLPQPVRRDHRSSLPFITLGITSLAVLAAASGAVQQSLEFNRAAIGNGQLWRVVTGHLVHWNTDHLFWDALMFGVLGFVCERADRRRFVACVLGSALAISASIVWLLPEMNLYRGLSGIDSALFILACTEWLRESRQDRNVALLTSVIMALLGFAAKLVYEVTTGATLFVNSAGAGFVPLPLVHAVGALIGAGAALWSGAAERLEFNPVQP